MGAAAEQLRSGDGVDLLTRALLVAARLRAPLARGVVPVAHLIDRFDPFSPNFTEKLTPV